MTGLSLNFVLLLLLSLLLSLLAHYDDYNLGLKGTLHEPFGTSGAEDEKHVLTADVKGGRVVRIKRTSSARFHWTKLFFQLLFLS